MAVLLTAARLLLPYAEEYHQDVTAAISQKLGQTVEIDSLTAELHGVSPTLVINQLSLFDKTGKHILFHVDKVHIGFSLLRSIEARTPIPSSLSVQGSTLFVVRKQDATLHINNYPVKTISKNGSDASSFQPVVEWLFYNSRLTLDQISIDYHDESLGRSVRLNNINIKLRNSKNRHQVDALASLPDYLGSQLGVSIDLISGDIQDIDTWKVNSYVAADNVALKELLAWYPDNKIKLSNGAVNLRLWSEWTGIELKTISGKLDFNEVQPGVLQTDKAAYFKRADLDFELSKENSEKWRLDVSRLQITEQNNSVRQPSRLTAEIDIQSQKARIYTDVLYIKDFVEIIQTSQFVDANTSKWFAHVKPRGELHDIDADLHWSDEGVNDFDIALRMSNVATNAWAVSY
ncbi:MAG: hypothetical protein HUJ30_01085 [Gammaproteobacteria bacterium]|nr:hypothetical protein [Gammaproteobacteria bacterium]